MGSISKWNSKKADRYVALKEGDVLCANQIGKGQDYYSEKRNNIYRSGHEEPLKGGSTMKGNIKKLAVFVFIATIAMFIAVGMASAGSTLFHPIRGHYVVTGAGHNFVSTTGFDANYKPNPCPQDVPAEMCIFFQDIMIFQGDYTFNKDGTGTFTQLNRGIETPPLQYNIKIITYEFIYTKTSEHRFTYQLKPGTYIKAEFIAGGQTGQTAYFDVDGFCEGVLSQDSQNLNVSCGPPNLLLTAVDISTTPATKLPVQTLWSESIVGIRVTE